MFPESCVVVIQPEQELLDAMWFHFQVNGYECIGVTSPDSAVRSSVRTAGRSRVMDFGAVGRPTRDLRDRLAKVLPHRTKLLLLANRKDDPEVLAALERYAYDCAPRRRREETVIDGRPIAALLHRR